MRCWETERVSKVMSEKKGWRDEADDEQEKKWARRGMQRCEIRERERVGRLIVVIFPPECLQRNRSSVCQSDFSGYNRRNQQQPPAARIHPQPSYVCPQLHEMRPICRPSIPLSRQERDISIKQPFSISA